MNSTMPLSDDRCRESRELVTHLQESEIFQTYAAAFESATGLPIALRALGALASPLHDSRARNSFCALMGSCSKSCAGCLRQQHTVEDGAETAPKSGVCFAGLTESMIPVRIGERVVAYLQTGQILHRPPTEAGYRRAVQQLREWGASLDAAQARKAFFASPVMPRMRYESVLRLLGIFADHLAVVANQIMVKQAAAELPSVARARSYIAEHLADEISLGEVAHAVGMSPFYFCKTFHKVTGVTFIDYVARLRVEKVKQLLINPHVRISEAAFEAGFQSLSQFNRVFRRVAGEAPTVYRDRIHGPDAIEAAA